jgi:hypothetical protein
MNQVMVIPVSSKTGSSWNLGMASQQLTASLPKLKMPILRRVLDLG